MADISNLQIFLVIALSFGVPVAIIMFFFTFMPRWHKEAESKD